MNKVAITAAAVLLIGGAGYFIMKPATERKVTSEVAQSKQEGTSEVIALGDFAKASGFSYLYEVIGTGGEGDVPSTFAIRVSGTMVHGVWQLEKPVDALGDPEAIAGFIAALASLPATEPALEAEPGRVAIGDAQPTLTVTFRLPEGEVSPDTAAPDADNQGSPEVVLKFMTSLADSTKIFVTTSTSPQVAVTSSEAFKGIVRLERDFMRRQVVNVTEAEIRNLTLKGGSREPVDFVRAEAGFAMIRPLAQPADATVKKFIADLQALKFDDMAVSPGEDEVKAFEVPDYSIVWETTAGVASTLHFVERDGVLHAAYRPHRLIYKVPLTFKETLTIGPDAFVNH